MYRLIFSIAFFALLLTYCKHKIPEPAKPAAGTTTGTPNPPPPPPENPKDSVCFAEEVHPLLISNCTGSGCHNNDDATQGVNLSSYDKLIETVSGHLLLQVIQDPGPLGMPPEPHQKLTSLQVDLIRKWVQQGMKNRVDCAGGCDTTQFGFSSVVMPILATNCFGCHQYTTPVFTNYSGARAIALNGKLLCTINHAAGCKPMPHGGQKLSDCKIRLIRKWVEAGALDN